MAFDTILYEVADEIATVTLNRPSKLNAYCPTMGNELVEAMSRADADEGVRVIIMTGMGRAFCVGADMDVFSQDIKLRESNGSAPPDLRIWTYPTLMQNLKKPTIAAINGYSLGVGCTITLVCDVRIAAEEAKIGVVFPRVGLITELGSTYLLPKLIGASNAAMMMLTGRQFTAQECKDMGLVSYVLPRENLLGKAREIANDMLQCSPTSLALTRRALYAGMNGTIENALQFEFHANESCFRSAEHKEYVSSFKEKRKPDFRRLKG